MLAQFLSVPAKAEDSTQAYELAWRPSGAKALQLVDAAPRAEERRLAPPISRLAFL